MEADWEFEVGGDAPVIDAGWEGFVDLRLTPERAGDLARRLRSLPEAVELPALAAALERLNSQLSPVWTSKCDFWPVLGPAEWDADELDAPGGGYAHAMGCSIDLLPSSGEQWSHPQLAEGACRRLCSLLGPAPLRGCRVDLVVRSALVAPDRISLGITAYLTTCGVTPAQAKGSLESALAAFADALCPRSTLQ